MPTMTMMATIDDDMNHSLYFCLTRAQHTSLPGITTATARYNRDLNTTIMHWPGISTAPGEIAEGCCIDANSTSHRNIHVPTQEYPCGIDCHLNFAQKYPCARIRRLMLRFRSLELQLEAQRPWWNWEQAVRRCNSVFIYCCA